jgi:gamma-polyglutamate synthase
MSTQPPPNLLNSGPTQQRGPRSQRGRDLSRGLPPLVLRLRAAHIDILASRIEGPIPETPDLLFADRLLHEGERLLADSSELVTARRDLLTGMETADSNAERMALMKHHLRVSVLDPKTQTRDLDALRKWMDVDTLVERIDRRRRENAAQLELICRMLSRHPLRRAAVLLDRLLDSPWLSTRRVATEVLAGWVGLVVTTGKDVDEESIDPPRTRLNALVRMASERGGDPLTARRALKVIPALHRVQARRLLLERLQPPREDEVVVQKDDFLVRAEAVRLAVALDEESARHAFTVARADPSETVRTALVRALAGSGYDNAQGLLDRMLGDGRGGGGSVSAAVAPEPTDLEGPQTGLAQELGQLREGESRTVEGDIDALARALVPMARNDHGFALRSVWGGGVRVTRGRRRVARLWRFLAELRRGDPGKRQYGDHLSGRTMDGTVLVPSARMADVSATEVAGQPVESGSGSWGPWLPLPDTLVDALWRGPLTLHTAVGVTSLSPPSGLRRLLAHLRIPLRIRRLDAARREALDAHDAWGRGAFKRELEALGFSLGGEVEEGPASQMLGSWAAVPAALVGVEWLDQMLGPLGARNLGIPELAAVLVLVAVLFGAHLVNSHLRVRRSRTRLPLVVGGWGTRGKSGVARLQAALFEGLGYDVVCKTTGCEAMMLRTAGDGRSEELYLFRPFDRATIWEHVDVMEHASLSGADVFVWECMGLRPRYVEQLQLGWTRDDISTITNTYPDHEDVMGPTGEDVAEVIARFMPKAALAITAEQSMTPILRDRAAQLGTTLVEVDQRGVESLPSDLLARFSYQEHPANVALVAEMAAQLGIDPEEAVVLMADHVVPDLGSLATFPRARTLGRIVEFTNGSSANERTGFMNNWERTSFSRHGAERDGGNYHVAVVNNRRDRVARSLIFADILVNDANAHRIVLIGTNLEGLQTYIREALELRLSRIDVFGGGPAGVEGRIKGLAEWLRIPSPGHVIGRQARRLGVSGRALDEALAELGNLSRTPPSTPEARTAAIEGMRARFAQLMQEVAGVFDPEKPALRDALFHTTEELNEGVAALVHQWAEELREALEFSALEVRCGNAVAVEAGLQAATDIATLEEDVRVFCRELFLKRRLVVVPDAKTTGDELIRVLAQSVPAGSLVRAMSVQNIKGTGLDLVYRWTYGRQVLRFAQELSHADTARRRSALDGILGWDEWCLPVAQEVLRLMQLAPEKQLFARQRAEAERHVRQAILSCKTKMGKRPSRGLQLLKAPKRLLSALFDPFASIWRRHRSERILRALEAGRISTRRARLLFQQLTLSQRGETVDEASTDASLL